LLPATSNSEPVAVPIKLTAFNRVAPFTVNLNPLRLK
jgi:hypothetical protein